MCVNIPPEGIGYLDPPMKEIGAVCQGNEIREIYAIFQMEPKCASYEHIGSSDPVYSIYCTAIIGNGLAEFRIIKENSSMTS